MFKANMMKNNEEINGLLLLKRIEELEKRVVSLEHFRLRSMGVDPHRHRNSADLSRPRPRRRK